MNGFSKLGKALGVLFLLPVIIITVYVVMIANSEIDIEDVSSVSISDSRYKHRYSDREDIERYVTLVMDSEDGAVQEIGDDLQEFTIEFEMKNSGVKTYRFYPSLRGDSLLKDGTGHIRKALNVEDVLCRDEFETIYSERYLPNAVLNTGTEKKNVSPSEYGWCFKKTDNVFYSYTNAEKSTELISVIMPSKNLSVNFLEFSITPDVCVTEYRFGDASYSKVENISLKDGDVLTVSVSAKWNEKVGIPFYGEGKWSFNCIYKETPVITLDKTSVNSGECIVIHVENCKAGDVLNIESDLPTCKTAVVYESVTDTSKKYALLPVGVQKESGSHSVKISSGDTSFDFVVDVKGASNGFAMKNVGAEVYNKVNSPDGIKEYEKLISSVLENGQNSFAWDFTPFVSPVEGVEETGYAWEVLYNGAPPQILFEGISYDVPEKTSVKSAAKGKVVFSGETSRTGKAVIIDHGCGIMTHYYHLSVLSATVGEEIDGNKLIALSGKSGYTDKADLYFAVSVNGVFVNPQMLFDYVK